MKDEYFKWLTSQICGSRYSSSISYRKLFRYLHDTDFRFVLPMDENRAEDGISLRYHFAVEIGYEHIPESLYGPCSVLEMLIALSMKCEDYMDDTDYGDRTKQWFWNMLKNLGIGCMEDSIFDERLVRNSLERFMNRTYEPDGQGGLFTIKNCPHDLRNVEIWHQLCWYINSIT